MTTPSYQDCEQKLRLIYFDFKFFSFALAIAEKCEQISIKPFALAAVKEQLLEIKAQYVNLSAQLKDNNTRPNMLQLSSSELEDILARIYRLRCALYDDLQLFASLENYTLCCNDQKFAELRKIFPSLKEILAEVDDALDEMIRLSNLYDFPPEAARIHFERLLDQALDQALKLFEPIMKDATQLQQKLRHHFLTASLGNLYVKAYQVVTRVLLLERWLKQLGDVATKLPTDVSNISYALAVKKIMTSYKFSFYHEFYEKIGTMAEEIDRAILQWIFKFTNEAAGAISLPKFFQELQTQEQQLRAKIAQREKQVQRYSLANDWLSSGIRLGTESFYYKFSEMWFNLEEEMTVAGYFRNYGFMDTQLTEGYRNFFTALSGGVLLGVEKWLFGNNAVLFSAVNSISQLLITDFLLPLAQLFHIDEGEVIKNSEKVKWLLGLIQHVGFFMVVTDFTREALGLLTTCYVVGTLSREVASRVVDFEIAKYSGGDNQKNNIATASAANLLVKPWVQQFAYVAGYAVGAKSYSAMMDFFVIRPNLSATELLSNKRLCLQYDEECKNAALAKLELPEGATHQEIHARWKILAREHHPDKSQVSGAEEFTMELNNARDRLYDLGL